MSGIRLGERWRCAARLLAALFAFLLSQAGRAAEPGGSFFGEPPPPALDPDWVQRLPAAEAEAWLRHGDEPAFPIATAWWSRNYQASLTLSPADFGPVGKNLPGGEWYAFEVQARGLYFNDQRIEFTGQESTLGVQGVVAGAYRRPSGEWLVGVEGELYLNQPYDRNLLADTPERRSYLGNFQIDPVEISQLVISARRGDWLLGLGKMVTPFGRTYFPTYLNDHRDAPFIRSEAILWRETGALVQYDPGRFVLTAAVTNGSENMDTNSSKALVSRVGMQDEWYALGASVKWQDGVGSEHQKRYNNHVGVDAMVRFGAWTLSGEAIYDQYGYRGPSFNPDTITWYHSLYYRDLGRSDSREPLTGMGYYVNLGYAQDAWSWTFNYGEFYPEQIGNPQHDVTIRRGLVKAVYRLSPGCEMFQTLLLENNLAGAQDGRTRKGQFLLSGLQISF